MKIITEIPLQCKGMLCKIFVLFFEIFDQICFLFYVMATTHHFAEMDTTLDLDLFHILMEKLFYIQRSLDVFEC